MPQYANDISCSLFRHLSGSLRPFIFRLFECRLDVDWISGCNAVRSIVNSFLFSLTAVNNIKLIDGAEGA